MARSNRPELEEIIQNLRNESGIESGCPLCGSEAFNHDTGECRDCGIDILRDWYLGT